MSVTEINFKCEHCGQEFWEDNFNIAVFLYGVFLLLGKENEYVGLTCPNCIKTILIKDNRYLVDYTKQNLSSDEMSFLIYLGKDPFVPELRYHSSIKHDPKQILAIKDFDIPFWSGPLTNIIEDELDYYMGENPHLQEEYLRSYMVGGEPPIGPNFNLWWFREDQIEELVKIENNKELRIFPRYVDNISEIENIERFCWENHIYLNNFIQQEEEIKAQINELNKIAKQNNMDLQEILEANPGTTTPEIIEYMRNRYVDWTKEKTFRIPTDFMAILTETPSPLRLPITNLSSYLSSYEFLWKTPHPFEDKGVPRSLIDVDLYQFQKPKKSFAFDEIAGEVRGHFEKGYGLNFIDENYEAFIKEYIELAQSSYFSYALVWALKEKYLKLLHEHMHKEDRLKARYSFYPEGPTWTITFDGKTIRGLRGKGFKYVHYLVLNKFKDYSHEDFNQLDGIEVNHIGKKKGSSPKGSSPTSIMAKEKIDHKAMIYGKSLQEIKRKYKDVRESLEDAKRGENPIEIKIAQKEYDEFSKSYYEYFTQHGRVKTFKTERKKIRDRIAKNMKEALDEIKEYDNTHKKRIWNHFNDVLGGLYASSISYRPNPDIDWHT